VSAKAVRLYEARGLLPRAQRTSAGYRLFDEHVVDTVRFIRQARSLGLGLDAAGEILAARRHQTPPCEQTIRLLDRRIAEIDDTLGELGRLRRSLTAARDNQNRPRSTRSGEVCPLIEHAAAAR
jgi:DNA-binding transcriptional MerR regulator